MTGAQQARLLLAAPTECTGGKDNIFLRGWAGASNLVGFRAEDDEQDRPTWLLYRVERQPHEFSLSPNRSYASGC